MASGSTGRGRGRGRGAQMQKAYEEYQRELASIQNSGAPAGLPQISLPDEPSSSDRERRYSDSQSSGTGSVDTTNSNRTDSDSLLERDLSPALSLMRGRGRGMRSSLFHSSPGGSGGSGTESTASPISCEIIQGPLRPREDILLGLDSTDEEPSASSDDDLVRRIRLMNAPSTSKGRGRGRGALPPVMTISSDLVQERVFPRPLGRGRGVTSVQSNLEPGERRLEPQAGHSSSSSCSDISDDLAVLQREVVVRRGVRGKPVPVICNYITLKFTKKCGLFEYHVDFDPPVEARSVSRKIIGSREDLLGTVNNFDGSKLYLPFKLQERRVEFMADHPFDNCRQVKTTIKYVKENKMEECVHFFNVLFRKIMQRLGLVEMKRNFYDWRTSHDLPQHKLEIWPGFITAVDAHEGGLLLMCDSSHRVLRTTNLRDVLRDLEYAGGDVKAKFEDYALRQIVITKYNKKNYHVSDIDWTLTPLSTFPRRGEEITLVDYYRNAYGIQIKDLSPPLIVHREERRADNRKPGPEIQWLVPELCYLTGLTDELRSNFRAMQDMARFTRITPHQRDVCLRKFIASVKENADTSRILSEWGLELGNPEQLEGREFSLARMTMGRGIEMEGKADFTRESTSNPCYSAVPVQYWAVICTDQDRNSGQTVVQTYANVCRNIGIDVYSDAKFVVVPRGRQIEEFRKAIVQTLHKDLQFIIVIVPRPQDDLYGMIKNICCVEFPIPSQVILSKTLGNEKRLRSVMAKIALQINCKLGGALWTLKIPLPDIIMFVGMDVYHDPKRKSDSVHGLVATISRDFTKYFSRVSKQPKGQETIDGIRHMFYDALVAFHEENNCWPDRIVVFRDGVGDGQLDTTEHHEVVQFTETVGRMCENKPKFSFTVVQKRINTRIFGLQGRSLENPKPGTVVDHTITRRFMYDFFLVSQLVREGTVSPTHYIVLHDNEGIAPDLIQKLAFVTSFMYYNWAGSIRVPAVCQYAHKLAYLSGQHLKTEPSKVLERQLYYL